jgi:hypothetical protein
VPDDVVEENDRGLGAFRSMKRVWAGFEKSDDLTTDATRKENDDRELFDAKFSFSVARPKEIGKTPLTNAACAKDGVIRLDVHETSMCD